MQLREEAKKQGSKNFLLLQQVVKNRERAQDVMQSPGAKVLYEMQNLSLGDRSESKSRVLQSVIKAERQVLDQNSRSEEEVLCSPFPFSVSHSHCDI